MLCCTSMVLNCIIVVPLAPYLSVAEKQAAEKKSGKVDREFLFLVKKRVEYAPFSFKSRSPGGHYGHLVPQRIHIHERHGFIFRQTA